MPETKEPVKKTPSIKKGTTKTEAIIGAGLLELARVEKSLVESMKKFSGLGEILENVSLQIAEKEAKISDLDVQFQEKKREAQVNLEISVKEDKAAVVRASLSETGNVIINSTELSALRSEHAKLKSDFSQEVSKEIGKAEGMAKSKYETEMRIKEAEFKAKEAENIASINSLRTELASSKADALAWRTALEQERNASIERAKASSVGSINFTPQGR